MAPMHGIPEGTKYVRITESYESNTGILTSNAETFPVTGFVPDGQQRRAHFQITLARFNRLSWHGGIKWAKQEIEFLK